MGGLARRRRINVELSDDAYGTLRSLAKTRGKSISDVLRGAVALEATWREVEAEGGRIVVEKPGGEKREILRI